MASPEVDIGAAFVPGEPSSQRIVKASGLSSARLDHPESPPGSAGEAVAV